jgi:flagellar biosynthesis protein FlhB
LRAALLEPGARFTETIKRETPVEIEEDVSAGYQDLRQRLVNALSLEVLLSMLPEKIIQGIMFIKKMKNIDYLFQVHNIDNESGINQILSVLRDIDCVTAVFKIGLDFYIYDVILKISLKDIITLGGRGLMKFVKGGRKWQIRQWHPY